MWGGGGGWWGGGTNILLPPDQKSGGWGGLHCDGSQFLDFKSMRIWPIISRYDVPAAAATPAHLHRAISPRYVSAVVVVVGRLASTGCQRPAASGQTTLLSARLAANPARLAGLAGSAGLAGLLRECTHAFSFPSSAWPACYRLRRPAPTGSAMATFRPKATIHTVGGGGGGGGKGGRVHCDGSQFLDFKSMRIWPIISRYDVPAAAATPAHLHRAISPRYVSAVVVVVGRLASTGCQRPAASGQTTLLSARLAANPARLAGLVGSAGLAGLVRVRACSVCEYTEEWWFAKHFDNKTSFQEDI